jgi:hypothetical protein
MSSASIQSTGAARDGLERRDGVERLEQQLRLSLQPVQPNREFVDHLHTRLVTPSSMTIERQHNAGLSLLLAALSLATGFFMVWSYRQIKTALNKKPLSTPEPDAL